MSKTGITVNLGDLSGPDGNAYAIIARVARTLRQCGSMNFLRAYQAEATRGTYDRLLTVTREWFDVQCTNDPAATDIEC